MHTELRDMCEFDDEYTNLDERIVDMKKNKVWGGMPEIKALSEILKVSFEIYVPLEDNYVNKISKIGEYKRTCNLLLDCSHYELIEFAENKVFSFVENDINDNIDTDENQTVIKARLIKNEEIDGYLIKNINKEYLETLGLLSDNNHNGKYIENLNSWFFHDNFKGYKDFCDQNNIPFIN